MAIFLSGGGSADDERLLWDECFQPGQRIVVWPYAQPPGACERAGRWFAYELAPRGHFAVDVWTDDAHDPGELDDADVLVILGGNTFALLAYVRDAGWLPAAGALLDRGGRVYGGSAGAVLMGADIALAGFLDPNDVGLTDTRALDRLGGAVVLPHYAPRYDADAVSWAERLGVPVIAIPERAGVVVNGSTARNVGPSEVVIVRSATVRQAVPPGGEWRLF